MLGEYPFVKIINVNKGDGFLCYGLSLFNIQRDPTHTCLEFLHLEATLPSVQDGTNIIWRWTLLFIIWISIISSFIYTLQQKGFIRFIKGFLTPPQDMATLKTEYDNANSIFPKPRNNQKFHTNYFLAKDIFWFNSNRW